MNYNPPLIHQESADAQVWAGSTPEKFGPGAGFWSATGVGPVYVNFRYSFNALIWDRG
jgi:hypothetical protein